MASVRIHREARKGRRPYFDNDQALREEVRANLNALVGFDVAETIDRFWDWFPAHGYGAVEFIPAAANLSLRNKPNAEGMIKVIVDVSLPEETAQNAGILRKGRALLDAIQSLENLTFLHGPERLGLLSWCEAMAKAEKDLRDFLESVGVREAEERHEDGNLAQGSKDSEHHQAFRGLTREVRARTEALGATLAETLKRVSPPSKDLQAAVGIEDSFPGRDAGRRSLHILGDLEARLSVAGFGPKEIGQLVIDLPRVKNGHSAESVRRHRERIETRIKARKPAIARRIRDDELARESIAAFKKRTGLDAREWIKSPEYRATVKEQSKSLPSRKLGREPQR